MRSNAINFGALLKLRGWYQRKRRIRGQTVLGHLGWVHECFAVSGTFNAANLAGIVDNRPSSNGWMGCLLQNEKLIIMADMTLTYLVLDKRYLPANVLRCHWVGLAGCIEHSCLRTLVKIRKKCKY